MRLIDADALKHAVSNIDMHGRSEQFYEIMGEIAEVLSSAPIIDAEPVVRCGECRNSSPIASDITDRPRHCWSGRGVRTGDGFSRVREDGYCDDGQRKEEST